MKVITSDPNTFNPNNPLPNKPQNSPQDLTSQIAVRVRQIVPDGNLTFEKFKEILFSLEGYGFPQLRDTPAGYRLFELLTVTSL